jgi:hypothetical protein
MLDVFDGNVSYAWIPGVAHAVATDKWRDSATPNWV